MMPAGDQVIKPAHLGVKSQRSREDCWSIADGAVVRRSEPARLDAPATAMIKSVIMFVIMFASVHLPGTCYAHFRRVALPHRLPRRRPDSDMEAGAAERAARSQRRER
jgi:hypothetical protein